MSEVVLNGQQIQVWPYMLCNACGYSTPASGGDETRHRKGVDVSVRCHCKAGILQYKLSRVEPKFPATGYEGKMELPAMASEADLLDHNVAAQGTAKAIAAATDPIVMIEDAVDLKQSPTETKSSSADTVILKPQGK